MVVGSSMVSWPRFFSSSSSSDRKGNFSIAEEQVVGQLATASRRYAGLDIRTAAGSELCSQYLAAIEAAAIALKLPPASRQYRAAFPVNYRSLFPADVRSYRPDVLEASLEHYNVIWVNGEKFEFSPDAAARAEELQSSWLELQAALERWSQSNSCEQEEPGQCRPTRAQLVNMLEVLDCAWAGFEERYITELADIEIKARDHIMKAIGYSSRLAELERENMYCEKLTEYWDVQRTLVAAVSRLNSVANINRKGRDDLQVEILLHAKSVMSRCEADQNKRIAARILATDVIESLEAMRQYLVEVSTCLERVDPHLGNNEGLVARLVDWEESWEIGAAYLLQPLVLDALCDTVAFIQQAQALAPKLTDMLEECDVEFFMVMPRLVWLRFLMSPVQQAPLLARLLPHRFADQSESFALEPELQDFSTKFTAMEDQLAKMHKDIDQGVNPNENMGAVRDLLAKRVIFGSDNVDEVFACLPSSQRKDAQQSVDALLHEMESWSIQLQRHCPDDWNQYMAVLVRCLKSSTEIARSGPFGV